MATVIGSTSASITAVLGTIQTVANTAQRTISTAAAGLDMLDIYVEGARTRQADKAKISNFQDRQNLLLESSLEQARRMKLMGTELSDPSLKQHFDAQFADLSALFAEPVVSQ